MRSVIVVGLAGRQEIRRFFEKEFVKRLKEHGVDAVASVECIPSKEELTEDAIVAAARERGVDMIMISYLVSIDATSAYHLPKNTTKFPQYYYWAYAYVNGPLYYAQGSQTVVLVTSIYETETENQIWSATTKTVDVHESKYKIIKSKSAAVIKRLRKDKLIK